MKNYEIIIGSPVDYVELVAYIHINNLPVALLNQDHGHENIKIEFFDEPKVREVPYEDFLEALVEAKKRLNK